MLRVVRKVDAQGKFIEDVLSDQKEDVLAITEDGNIVGYTVSVPLPDGFSAYVSKTNAFVFDLETGYWAEGLSEEEIIELTKLRQPSEIEQLRMDNAGLLLELAQVQARQDQADADNAALLLMIVEGGVV